MAKTQYVEVSHNNTIHAHSLTAMIFNDL